VVDPVALTGLSCQMFGEILPFLDFVVSLTDLN